MALIFFLLAGCPQNPLGEARALENRDRPEEAGARFLQAAKQDPANLAAWDGAIRNYCEKAVNVDQCMGVLDIELELLGNLQRHRDVLSQSLERRARARMDEGLAKAALADLDRAQKAGPERPTVYVARAKALLMLGRRSAAESALEEARKRDPKNAELREIASTLDSETMEDPFGGAP